LSAAVTGEVRFDSFSRGLYATDASIYQIMPAGVVLPKSDADVEATLAIAREHRISITPRGGGTSQCGQTVGPGLIVDVSKYLRNILAFDPACAQRARSAGGGPGRAQSLPAAARALLSDRSVDG